ncbi:MAG: hypothetical protein VW270_08230 [Candidatus Poseidoniales archaeon]
MADITQKDFKQLLEEQQRTTEMLRQSMMTAEEREAERLAAEARREARAEAARKGHETRRLNAEKEGAAAQDKTTDAIEANTDQQGNLADAEQGNRAKQEEEDTKKKADDDKNRSFLSKISSGINKLEKNAKDTAKKAGKTGLAILSGIAFGALLYAFGEFLQSDTFKELTDYLIGPDGLLSKIKSFGYKFPKDTALLATLLGGIALAFAKKPLGLLFKPIKLATKGITGGLKLLGGSLGGVAKSLKDRLPKLPFGKKDGAAPAAKPTPAASTKPTKGGPLGKVGASLASVGKGAGAGIGGFLKGMAGGLAAITNPLTLIGLAAVVLAINGIAFAVRIASPAFEPFGKTLESAGKTIREVFGGLGDFVKDIGGTIEGIIGSVGDSIGDVVDKISKMKTAGTDATTKQIKELSEVPADKIGGVAGAIERMKNALEGFGGGTFTKVMGKLLGSSGPIADILKLAEKSETLSKAATAIMAIAGSGVTYKQLMDEEKRQSRIAKLEERLEGGYTFTADRKKDEAELAKLQAQAPKATAGGQTANLQANLQSTFAADPRVEAMITSAINKSNIATQGITINNATQVSPQAPAPAPAPAPIGRQITDDKRSYMSERRGGTSSRDF